MATQLNAVRALLNEAIRAIEAGAHDAEVLCNQAKMFASEEIFKVTKNAMELHGGNGVMLDFGVERFLRDARTACFILASNSATWSASWPWTLGFALHNQWILALGSGILQGVIYRGLHLGIALGLGSSPPFVEHFVGGSPVVSHLHRFIARFGCGRCRALGQRGTAKRCEQGNENNTGLIQEKPLMELVN